jgi:hypothetical protein
LLLALVWGFSGWAAGRLLQNRLASAAPSLGDFWLLPAEHKAKNVSDPAWILYSVN